MSQIMYKLVRLDDYAMSHQVEAVGNERPSSGFGGFTFIRLQDGTNTWKSPEDALKAAKEAGLNGHFTSMAYIHCHNIWVS